MTVQDQDGRAQAIDVFQDKGNWIAKLGLRISARRFRGHEVACILLDVADISRMAAPECVLEQLPGPNTGLTGLPDGIAFEARNGGHTLWFAVSLAAFHHTLQC